MKSHASHPQALPRRTVGARLLGVRRAIARAARFAAKFLAGDAGALSDDSLWASSGDNICNTNSGNVGIGTTNPDSALHVYGDDYHSGIKLEDYGTGYGPVVVLRSTGYAGRTYRLLSGQGLDLGSSGMTGKFAITDDIGGGTARFVIDGSGNVGIGTTSPAHKLDVAGDGNFSGSLSANGQPCVLNGFPFIPLKAPTLVNGVSGSTLPSLASSGYSYVVGRYLFVCSDGPSSYPLWQPDTYYAYGALIYDNANGGLYPHVQRVTTAGVSGGTQPTWNESEAQHQMGRVRSFGRTRGKQPCIRIRGHSRSLISKEPRSAARRFS